MKQQESGTDLKLEARRGWIGRTSEADDVITPRLVDSFRATLGPHLADVGEGNAPGLHWCLAPDITDTAGLGPDGLAAKGSFLPPVPLPRRMWAAGEVRFLAPLRPGDPVHRRSTVHDVTERRGKSGLLCFVTVRHQIATAGGIAIEEDQIIVYREAGSVQVEPAGPDFLPQAAHQHEVDIDPVLLFRYSALTFNAHRIHYDAPYASESEHYPGLVIHGPLQATLLLNFAVKLGGVMPKTFSFRGTRAATGQQILRLCANESKGRALTLRAESPAAGVTMTAIAQW